MMTDMRATGLECVKDIGRQCFGDPCFARQVSHCPDMSCLGEDNLIGESKQELITSE